MSQKKKVHIVPHSHWDREWYMPFENHRYRLVKLMDSLIEKMENDPEYKYYHLDGQMILLDDYLEIKPYMWNRLKKLIDDGRIQVGPWYVLQDEYLISDEANVRNMLVGLAEGEAKGVNTTKIGYLPDSFGNISQMPQILSKCGIDSVVFGRGVFNIAEIVWEAPDGSRVVGGHFTHWYNNANELPTDEEAAKAKAGLMLERFNGASKINDYLGMNGCDHQPVQLNLGEALETFNKVTSDEVEFVHSNLEEYMNAVKADTSQYPVISEEMAGQHTDGNATLISTASARIYMKQKNWETQNSLERIAEPLSVRAYLSGAEYPTDYLNYAWKSLLKNHAHDSICGCSVDEVHSEMMTRYEKILQVADDIKNDAIEAVKDSLAVEKDKGYPVVVFNNTLYNRSEIVEVIVDVPEEEGMKELCLTDKNGNVVSETVKVEPHVFTYELPDDAFREVIYVNRYTFRFAAIDVPAFGYSVYYATNAKTDLSVMKHTENSAENDYISLKIEKNGSLTVTDKQTQKVYKGLNIYEDTPDIGDEYIFRAGEHTPITTENSTAEIILKEATSSYVTFGVSQELLLPESYNRKLNCYSENRVPFTLETEITLNRFSRKIDVKVLMNNASDCHRIRAIFKNDIKTDTVLANGQFDIVRRNIATDPQWKCPTNEQRIQSFVALKGEDALLVATRGLYEYEVLRDGSNTLGINLLRCTDQLGDWGEFPTPDAQCKGINIAEYQIFVGNSDIYDDAQKEAFQFASGDMVAYQIKYAQNNGAELANSLISLDGVGVWSTALKKQDKGNAVVLRLYNTKETANKTVLHLADYFKSVTEANMLEQAIGCEIANNSCGISLEFAPKEIKTLLLKV